MSNAAEDWRSAFEAIDRVLRDGTYDAIWCSVCGMFVPGPLPIAAAAIEQQTHTCRTTTRLERGDLR